MFHGGPKKKKCYTTLGGEGGFEPLFFLAVKKKEGPFSKLCLFFLIFKKKIIKKLAFSETNIGRKC